MKQLSCSAMGGECDEMISGANWDEFVANGMKHLEEKHPEMAAKVKAMTPEEMEKWAAETKPKWEAAPEMEVAEEKMAA